MTYRSPRLMTLVLLFMPGTLCAQATSPAADRVQFDTDEDLLECLPGDTLRVETVDNRSALIWTINYDNKTPHACTKDFQPGDLTAMSTLRFRCRSDAPVQMWVQLNEASGEKYYKTITIEQTWRPIVIPLSDLALNEDRVVNGELDIGNVNRLVLLDVASLSGNQTGVRKLWFDDLEFSSGDSRPTLPKPDFAVTLQTGKVGLTCVPRDFRETESQWLDLFSRANDSGVQLLSLQADFWSRTETEPGVYDFSSWDRFFAILDDSGYEFELSRDIGGPFFRENIDAPADIQFRSFTDPPFLDRFGRYLTAYLDRFGERHAYIVIHAEGADAYFAEHPSQFDDYCRFLTQMQALVKRHSPHIRVGVNTEPTNDDSLLSDMAEAVDFMAYDVLQGQIRAADGFENIVARLAEISGEKKIAFQNVGWSTSQTDNSSDEQQAEFICEFYDVLFRYRDQIEYASFGAMYDHDVAITGPAYRQAFPNLPAEAVDKIIDSMSHCGMIRSDGTPKPGWQVFRDQIREYYER